MRNNYRLFVLTGVFITSSVFSSQTLAADSEKQGFDYSDFAEALKINVDDAGMVNYRKLWDDNAKIAFWLNAYNALTLEAIIDNYPIKSSFFKSRIYPKNSIRQITGVWDKIKFKVMGQNLTLGHIEHKLFVMSLIPAINFKSSSTTRRVASLPIPPNSKSRVPITEYTCHQYSSGLALISSKSMAPKRALADTTKRNPQY